MGDKRRFDLFAKFIRRNFDPAKYRRVADIAGGKGHLQLALREQGFKTVVTYDVRRHRAAGLNYRTELLTENTPGQYDLVVAMHPDEATDVAITAAASRKIPFVICPCCIMPNTTVMWGKATYRGWVAHLRTYAETLGYSVLVTELKMTGKNAVIVGRRR